MLGEGQDQPVVRLLAQMLTANEVVQPQTFWQESRDWIIAGAAIFGVVVSTFPAIYRRKTKPRLSLLYDPDEAGDAVVTRKDPVDYLAHVRLRVKNKEGKRPAEDVEVVIEDVHAGNGVRAPRLIQRALRVSNSEPPKTTMSQLPPGVSRHVDFLYRHSGEMGMRVIQSDFCFAVYPVPTDEAHNVTPNGSEIEVILAVTARNAEVRRYRIKARYAGGSWDPTFFGQMNTVPDFPKEAFVIGPPERIRRWLNFGFRPGRPI